MRILTILCVVIALHGSLHSFSQSEAYNQFNSVDQSPGFNGEDIQIYREDDAEPAYNLHTLEKTEANLQLKKHLSEILFAKEMEANGAQLGEMNMLLFKKWKN